MRLVSENAFEQTRGVRADGLRPVHHARRRVKASGLFCRASDQKAAGVERSGNLIGVSWAPEWNTLPPEWEPNSSFVWTYRKSRANASLEMCLPPHCELRKFSPISRCY